MKRRSSADRAADKAATALIEELTEIGVELALSEQQPGVLWLGDFLRARRAGRPIREETLAWLEVRFAKILAGQAPDLALDIKKRRGRQLAPSKLREEFQLADKLLDLYASGHTREKSIESVCVEHGVPEWRVIDVWERAIAPMQLTRRRRRPPEK